MTITLNFTDPGMFPHTEQHPDMQEAVLAIQAEVKHYTFVTIQDDAKDGRLIGTASREVGSDFWAFRHVLSRAEKFEIIPSTVLVGPQGQRVSPYGSAPWMSDAEKALWHEETVGFTVRNKINGTVGIGRQPWKTREEAETWLKD